MGKNWLGNLRRLLWTGVSISSVYLLGFGWPKTVSDALRMVMFVAVVSALSAGVALLIKRYAGETGEARFDTRNKSDIIE